MGSDGIKKTPLAEHLTSPDKSQDDDFSVNISEDLIVLKTDNLIVEAKIISSDTQSNPDGNFGHTFNPTERSRISEYDDQIELNDTSKQFIFKLLKSFIEDLYLKVNDRQEFLQREEEKDVKIAEYENELRLLKDWNSFILVSMNKLNIMDNFENCAISIEKYLISELAKYSELEDLNIYYTYDYRSLIKIKNHKEYVQEEVPDELYGKIKENFDTEDLSSSQIKLTNCLSFL